MKLRDIIDQVSEMYVNANGKINDLYEEIREIERILDDEDQLDNLLWSEYRRLINKKCDLYQEIERTRAYRDGICDVRELLMNIGFDIKIDYQNSEELERYLYDLKCQMINDEIFAKVMREERKK